MQLNDTQQQPFDSAYGGEGWSPRTQTLEDEIGDLWSPCGINSEWAPLRSVLLHRPGDELAASQNPQAVQMLEQLDIRLARSQHDEMASAYEKAGVTVRYVDPPVIPTPNQMFVADLMFATPEGIILARPASTVRAGEERWVARHLADAGIPIIRTISGTAVFEGADAMWLDPQTIILGRGLRTNDEATAQITETLEWMGVETIVVDLPYGSMHLMGMLRIVDSSLAIAWPKRFVHRGVDALRARGYEVAWLPDDSEANHNKAFNFVTLGPKSILMAGGCPQTQSFYESLGIQCTTVPVDELRKAAGAIGCLSGVVEREII
ncbi:MAG: arginine deiminase family protein [Chloroflexota bacterium]